MPMNRTFFLACATLGIAAASSAPAYARPCSDLDSDRESHRENKCSVVSRDLWSEKTA